MLLGFVTLSEAVITLLRKRIDRMYIVLLLTAAVNAVMFAAIAVTLFIIN